MSQIQLKICRPHTEDETLDFGEAELFLGRDAGNQIVLNDADVSRVHCSIFRKDSKWRVKDLQSTNGTFVNGVPVKERDIAPGDVIIVGKSRVYFTQLQEVTNQPAAADVPVKKDESYKLIQLIEPAPAAGPFDERTEAKTKSSLEKLTKTLAALRRGFSALAPLFADPRRAGRTVEFETLARQTAQTLSEIFPGVEYALIEAIDPQTALHEKLTVTVQAHGLQHAVEPDAGLRERIYADKKALLVQVRMNQNPDSPLMAVIGAPLLLADNCTGLILLGCSANLNQFDNLELELLGLFALQISVAFENFRLMRGVVGYLDQLLLAHEREPLFEQQLLNLDRVRQLNTVAQQNLNELSTALRRINQAANYLDSEVPAAHWTRAEVDHLLKDAAGSLKNCEQLVTYARRGKIHIARFNPTQLLAEIIDLTRGLLGETIWVDADLPDKIPLIEYDALLFEQFMINLILLFRNAMLEGGMLKIHAAEFAIDADFVAQKHALKTGPGIRIVLEATSVLDLEGIESTGTGLPAAAESNELRRISEFMLKNNALLEIEKTNTATTVFLYFLQSQIVA